jgi:NAD dependent epimerase/dehydratase
MNWNGTKVLVTGAGGFIGSHLCEALLNHGADVSAMLRYSSRSDWGNLEHLSKAHRDALEIVAGNVEDSHFVAKQVKGRDVVFHLAALIAIPYSYLAPLAYVRTNVEGTVNVMEAARNLDVKKIIHTSTSETYGTAQYAPIDEQHPLQGQSPYSASKIGADKIVESYHLSFGLPVTTVRPFNTYGPRQSARAVIPTIISQVLSGNEVRLGALDPVRDLTFVKDTVMGFMKTAECESAVGQTINIGFGKGITIGELARTIMSVMNTDKPIVQDEKRFRPSNSEVYHLLCDNRRAKEVLGWSPNYSLVQGLQETVDFVAANLNLFKPDKYTL